MGELDGLSHDDVERALRRLGFIDAPDRGRGSHLALLRADPNGVTRLAVVPRKRSIPGGTTRGILRQTGISRESFVNALRGR